MKGFPRQSPGSLRWRLAVPAAVAVALLAVGITLGAYFTSSGSDGTSPPSNAKFVPGPSDLWTAVDYTENGSPIVADELLVRFKDNVPEEEREAILGEAGAETARIGQYSGIRVVKVDPAQREQILQELSSNENIESVGPNLIIRANEPLLQGEQPPQGVSDIILEQERARQEEEAKPRFEGVVNGIRLYPTGAGPAAQRKSACDYVRSEELEYVTISEVAGTPMEIAPTYLPAGAEEVDPMWPPMICKGVLAYVERRWLIRGRADFSIRRHEGEQATSIEASADRISAATVGGKRAVLVEPITPDGYGYSMAIVAEDFGTTVVVAFGLPLEETRKIAEGLK